MYVLYAPVERFGILPGKANLFTEEVTFFQNIALCEKKHWRDFFCGQGMEDITPDSIKKRGRLSPPHKIMISIFGGWGDTLMTTPVIAALKEKYPSCQIHVACHNTAAQIFQNNPNVDMLIAATPFCAGEMISLYDEIIDFAGVIVWDENAKKTPAPDLHFQRAGLPIPKEPEKKRERLYLTAYERSKTGKFWSDTGIDPDRDKIIALHNQASSLVRSWPEEYTITLAEKLAEKDLKVIILGENPLTGKIPTLLPNTTENINPDRITPPPFNLCECPKCGEKLRLAHTTAHKNIHYLTGKSDMIFTAAVLERCSLLVGVDSSIMHMSDAIDIPSLSLTGPFPDKLRCEYFKRHKNITAKMDCVPCFSHKAECDKGVPSPCMLTINPEDVFNETIDYLMELGVI